MTDNYFIQSDCEQFSTGVTWRETSWKETSGAKARKDSLTRPPGRRRLGSTETAETLEARLIPRSAAEKPRLALKYLVGPIPKIATNIIRGIRIICFGPKRYVSMFSGWG